MYQSIMEVNTFFVVSVILCLLNFATTAPIYNNSAMTKGRRRGSLEGGAVGGSDSTEESDDSSLQIMALPTRGFKEKMGTGYSRMKRYALEGSRWKIKDLTYNISKYPDNLNRSDVDREIARALNAWSEYTDLNFKSKSGQVNIEIRFDTRDGEGNKFDGPGGTYARAYYPQYGGDVYFDSSENWSINSNRGINLYRVAVHEFGHSLGLRHSNVKSSVMHASYRGFGNAVALDTDDVTGIQVLYGRKIKNKNNKTVESL